MPDALAEALAHPGLGWLIATAAIAGLVRGFVGFGTALIYLPVAAQVLDPLWAILTVVVMDIFGPLPNLPRAWEVANKVDLSRLWTGTLLFLPLGLWILTRVDRSVFQITTGSVALFMVTCLVFGLRYHGPLGAKMVFGSGSLAGFLGGVAGLPGPPVILLYMASPNPAAVVRASTMTYLFGYDLMLIALLAAKGALSAIPLVIGLLLAGPNILGNVIGGYLFRPGLERTYRFVAYVIIAASAMSALTQWE